MTIYKISYFINKRKRNGEFDWKERQDKETVVIDNLKTAKSIFKKYKNECECSSQYSNYQGKCMLFIPHIHDSGELAYWPDDEEYIDLYKFGD